MIEQVVFVPEATDAAAVPALIEAVCATEGMTCKLRGTLKTHPGSVHWHFRRSSAPGTLEITTRELWLTMQAGRSGVDRAGHESDQGPD